MTISRFAVLAAASAVLGCATPSGTPIPVSTPAPGETKPPGFQAKGEIFFDAQGAGTSVAYDDFRMVGPTVNMARDASGKWGGNIGQRNMILTVAPGRITGDGVDLYVVRKKTTVSVQGMYFQRQVWFTIKPTEIQGTTDGDTCSFDLTRTPQPGGWFTGGVGCGGNLRMGSLQLLGDAANLETPTLPQLILALIGVLPF